MSQLFQTQIHSFPGALPVSVDHGTIAKVAFGYIFSLKADGNRVFLIFGEGSCFVVERDMQQIKHIGTYKTAQDSVWYMFDAEILPRESLILIFDTLVFRSQSIIRLEIGTRLEMAKWFCLNCLEVVQIHKDDPYLKQTLPSNYDFVSAHLGNFTIRVKPVFTLNHLADIWNNKEKRETHNQFPEDGLIFTRRCCQYKPFREDPESVYKWKPLVTLDFYVVPFEQKVCITDHPCTCTEGNVMLCTSSKEEPIECFSLATFSSEDLELYCGNITECKWKLGNWEPMRLRMDKPSPNRLETVLKTLPAITNPVLFKEFLHS